MLAPSAPSERILTPPTCGGRTTRYNASLHLNSTRRPCNRVRARFVKDLFLWLLKLTGQVKMAGAAGAERCLAAGLRRGPTTRGADTTDAAPLGAVVAAQ